MTARREFRDTVNLIDDAQDAASVFSTATWRQHHGSCDVYAITGLMIEDAVWIGRFISPALTRESVAAHNAMLAAGSGSAGVQVGNGNQQVNHF